MLMISPIGSYDGTVRLWDLKSQSHKPLMVLSEAQDSISSVLVKDHQIIAGSIDGKVRVYDIRMGLLYVDVIGRKYFRCSLQTFCSIAKATIRSCDLCQAHGTR